MSHVAAAGRRLRRSREKRFNELPSAPLPNGAASRLAAPDPVHIAVLAMEYLGRASVRACSTGTEVCVAVPDEATAAIFRAALARTGRVRTTDLLVRIVVD